MKIVIAIVAIALFQVSAGFRDDAFASRLSSRFADKMERRANVLAAIRGQLAARYSGYGQQAQQTQAKLSGLEQIMKDKAVENMAKLNGLESQLVDLQQSLQEQLNALKSQIAEAGKNIEEEIEVPVVPETPEGHFTDPWFAEVADVMDKMTEEQVEFCYRTQPMMSLVAQKLSENKNLSEEEKAEIMAKCKALFIDSVYKMEDLKNEEDMNNFRDNSFVPQWQVYLAEASA